MTTLQEDEYTNISEYAFKIMYLEEEFGEWGEAYNNVGEVMFAALDRYQAIHIPSDFEIDEPK